MGRFASRAELLMWFLFLFLFLPSSIVAMSALSDDIISLIFSHAFTTSPKRTFCVSDETHIFCTQESGDLCSGATGELMLAKTSDCSLISYGELQKFRGALGASKRFWLHYVHYMRAHRQKLRLDFIDAKRFVDNGYMYRLCTQPIAKDIEAIQIMVARNITAGGIASMVKKFPRLRALSVLCHPMYSERGERINACGKNAREFRKKIALQTGKKSDCLDIVEIFLGGLGCLSYR
jgi:hypothetical protein